MNILANLFAKLKERRAAMMENQTEVEAPVWCIAGNVILEHSFGEAHEIRRGTKHFAPGAKVYCISFRQGAEALVVGRHRKSKRWIRIYIRTAYLTNLRAELVYNPQVVRALNSFAHARWDGSAATKTLAEQIVAVPWLQNASGGEQPFVIREKAEGSGDEQT